MLFRPIWMKDPLSGKKLSSALEKVKQLQGKKLIMAAEKAPDYKIRICAVERLEDRAVLSHVAQTDSRNTVRQAAVERLEDRAVLSHIAQTDSDHAVRQAAVKRLEDRAVLSHVAQTDSHWGVRKAAVERLEDQAVLAHIAQTDPHEVVSKAALQRMIELGCDSETVYRIAAGEKRGRLLDIAFEVIEQQLSVCEADNAAVSDDMLRCMIFAIEKQGANIYNWGKISERIIPLVRKAYRENRLSAQIKALDGRVYAYNRHTDSAPGVTCRPDNHEDVIKGPVFKPE